MKPQIQKLTLSGHSSFVADRFITPYFETPWHYHPEYEIVLIIEGRGKRFIGNHVSDYEVGDLCLLGPNLPHLFRKENANAIGGSLVIHFKEEFAGKEFGLIPEMQKIRIFLNKSRMGIQLNGRTKDLISKQMIRLTDLQGMERLICLLELLSEAADSDEYELLSSPEIIGQNSRDNDRLNNVFDYVMRNFRNEINMHEIASLANMSYSGFCRYFKNRTKKNFSHFVNEIRIGYACKRLMETDSSVGMICFESGYNNMTNFIDQFKKIVKSTPYTFKRNMAAERVIA
jgi:AraC-like DNA-binding protein